MWVFFVRFGNKTKRNEVYLLIFKVIEAH